MGIVPMYPDDDDDYEVTLTEYTAKKLIKTRKTTKIITPK